MKEEMSDIQKRAEEIDAKIADADIEVERLRG